MKGSFASPLKEYGNSPSFRRVLMYCHDDSLNQTHEIIENFYIFGLVLNSFSFTQEWKDYICYYR